MIYYRIANVNHVRGKYALEIWDKDKRHKVNHWSDEEELLRELLKFYRFIYGELENANERKVLHTARY